jgi:hypothetical protein
MTRAVHPRPASPLRPHHGVVQGKIYDMFGRKLDTADEAGIDQYTTVMDRVNHDRLREFREMLMRDLGELDAAGIRTVRRLNQILGDLPISAGQPPVQWAVVDSHLPAGDSVPFWKMSAPATMNIGVSAVAEEQNLVRYVYRAASAWDINLYWPRGWNPPASNRLNLIPNGEFGNGLGGMKHVQPVNVQFGYTQYGGGAYMPPSAYIPAGPKKEPERDDNYYRFQEEFGHLESLYDDEAISEEEFEKRLKVLKEEHKQL